MRTTASARAAKAKTRKAAAPARAAKEAAPPAGPAARKLAWYFHRNGYVRRHDAERRVTDGSEAYKKGDEVRLVAGSTNELKEVRRLLKEAGFDAGRPFRKANQFRQPVYGRTQVARFLRLVRDAAKGR